MEAAAVDGVAEDGEKLDNNPKNYLFTKEYHTRYSEYGNKGTEAEIGVGDLLGLLHSSLSKRKEKANEGGYT